MKRELRVAALLVCLMGLTLPAGTQQAAGAPLPAPEIKKKVEDFTRRLYGLGPAYRVVANEPREAKLPGFLEVAIEVGFQDSSDQTLLLISKDGRHLVRGEVFQADVDPFASVRAQMKLDGSPYKGPADAKVVVVEYADFQCPSCRQLYDVLKQIVPLYPQVKFVFKDFPLEQIHPWARNAAHAGSCANQQDRATFWKVHDLLFENQATITSANHWDRLLDFAAQSGLDTDAFRQCLSAPETKAAIDASIQEALALRIANTPTTFINGRRMVGGNREQLEQLLQYELAATKPITTKPSARP